MGLLQERMSRRQVFALAIGSAALNTACGSKEPPTSIKPTRREVTPTVRNEIPLVTKKEARDLLNTLPDSSYKEFVFQYAGPFLQDEPPKEVTLGGLKFKVFNSSVTEQRGWQTISATASITPPSAPVYQIQQDNQFTLLLPYFKKNGDIASTGSIPIKKGTTFAEGIGPTITILSPDGVSQDQFQDLKKTREFAILKECFSVAYAAAYIETIVKEMTKANLPLHIDNGTQKLEAVAAVYAFLIRQNGRLTALQDVGPLLLTVKIAGSERIAGSNVFHPAFKDLFADVVNKDFGDKDHLVQNTIQYINTNQVLVEKAKGEYAGDLNKQY